MAPQQPYPTRQQVSSGGVVIRPDVDGGLQTCLIARRVRSGQAWCLPKGKLEPGETAEQAALREVQEETGVTARIIETLGDIHYSYVSREERARFDKTVSFFLMRHITGEPADMSVTASHIAGDVETAQWFPFDQAISVLSYDNERHVMQLAQEAVAANPALTESDRERHA